MHTNPCELDTTLHLETCCDVFSSVTANALERKEEVERLQTTKASDLPKYLRIFKAQHRRMSLNCQFSGLRYDIHTNIHSGSASAPEINSGAGQNTSRQPPLN